MFLTFWLVLFKSLERSSPHPEADVRHKPQVLPLPGQHIHTSTPWAHHSQLLLLTVLKYFPEFKVSLAFCFAFTAALIKYSEQKQRERGKACFGSQFKVHPP